MNELKQKTDGAHNRFDRALRAAAREEEAGWPNTAMRRRVAANVAYHDAIRKLRLGPIASHEAACRHATAAGDPLVQGGQGRSDAEVTAYSGAVLIAAIVLGAIAIVAMIVYAPASCSVIGG